MNEATPSTMARDVLGWARRAPRAVAVVEGSAQYSYGELAEHTAKLALALRAAGVAAGNLVLVENNNRYVHLVSVLALEVLGAVVSSCWLSDLTEDNKAVRHAELLITENLGAGALPGKARLRLDQGFLDAAMSAPLPPGWEAMLEAPSPLGAGVRLTRTSGTTGEPKYMLLKRSLMDNSVRHAPAFLNMRNEVFNFIALHNFNFLGTYVFGWLALRFGGCICFSSLETALADVNRFSFSYLNLLVGDASRIIAAAEALPGHCNPCSVSVIGGAMPPAMQQGLLRRVATELRNAYQANEALAVARFDRSGISEVLAEMEVRITGDDGQPLAEGEAGVIELRSPRVIDRYEWDEALTAEHFLADGWFRTSDVGKLVGPGQLVVLGRRDEMLNAGGVKVPPLPIEERIRALPGVTDAVLLVFDDQHGAGELHVVVERADPARDAAIQDALPGTLRGFYYGGFRVHYVASLPRTETGKVQRHMVRSQLG